MKTSSVGNGKWELLYGNERELISRRDNPKSPLEQSELSSAYHNALKGTDFSVKFRQFSGALSRIPTPEKGYRSTPQTQPQHPHSKPRLPPPYMLNNEQVRADFSNLLYYIILYSTKATSTRTVQIQTHTQKATMPHTGTHTHTRMNRHLYTDTQP